MPIAIQWIINILHIHQHKHILNINGNIPYQPTTIHPPHHLSNQPLQSSSFSPPPLTFSNRRTLINLFGIHKTTMTRHERKKERYVMHNTYTTSESQRKINNFQVDVYVFHHRCFRTNLFWYCSPVTGRKYNFCFIFLMYYRQIYWDYTKLSVWKHSPFSTQFAIGKN